jgi:hypothetical protein
MAARGLVPTAFHSKIDGTDRRHHQANIVHLSPGDWLTVEVKSRRGACTSNLLLLDRYGDPVGYITEVSAESLNPRLAAGWTVRVLAHTMYDGHEGDVGLTVLIFAYAPEQAEQMEPQMDAAAELIRSTGLSYKLVKQRKAGLLTFTLQPDGGRADRTAQAAGCAGALLMLALPLVVVGGLLIR